ncbi:MAG TPA: translation initiation factor IF-2 [Blattabacteriaceae bacterium]
MGLRKNFLKEKKYKKHRKEKSKFKKKKKLNQVERLPVKKNLKKIKEKNSIKNKKENNLLKVPEFITVNEFSCMMQVSPTEVIGTCISLGIPATMNQRLNAETILLVADEFGYKIEFIDFLHSEKEGNEKDLKSRPPVVSVMGHVDHGKTSLLDYILNTNRIAGEHGGITQHIGAYSVKIKKGIEVTFIDTPGHEAFTAMRARGVLITDIAIIVIAVDAQVMPQTKEVISHAITAGVPMIFAINKIDKTGYKIEKIYEQLANMNILVEKWGGKYPTQEISAKTGYGVDKLMEKIISTSQMLNLKANPNNLSSGTVLESSIDKGRGYVSTVLIQEGTLRTGYYLLAGCFYGKVKVILDERRNSIQEAGPSKPVTIIGLNGAPNAGERFRVFKSEKEVKSIALRREHFHREQKMQIQKRVMLNEAEKRFFLKDLKEFKIILKVDVDGSLEALIDALLRLSTEKIKVNIIHKEVGSIKESDVLLAKSSNAMIIGFNVRPIFRSKNYEGVQMKLYSVIYHLIDDIKRIIEDLHKPKEKIIGKAKIREVFKIPSVGSIAGCVVTLGKIIRPAKVRHIRGGVVIYTGELSSLKIFKEDVKEVKNGQECGVSIKNYNDLLSGDVLEFF